MAAVLACGVHAVLSSRSAAQLWKLLPMDAVPGVTHVTVPFGTGRQRRRNGIVVYCSDALAVDEVTQREGIPVTTAARTLLDLAAAIPRRALERATDEAERLRLCDASDLRAIALRHRGERGAGALNSLLAAHLVGATRTRSELEERFLALCRQRGIREPLANAALHGLTVDFLWSAERVVVEVDGHASHQTRRAFQDDRDRDSLLAAHRYRTLRFTWWDVTRRPAVVAHRLKRVLDAGG